MTNSTHPEELLAEYVDGALASAERTEVEVHLRECSTCRKEVDLAATGRRAAASLPEVPVPLGVTGPVLRRARSERPRLARVARPLAFAAAAAVVGIFAFAGLRNLGSGDDAGSGAPAAGTEDGGAEAAPPEATRAPADDALLFIDEQAQDYDEEAIRELADETAEDLRTELSGSPIGAETTAEFDRSSKAQFESALACLREGVGTQAIGRPVGVIRATYRGEPAFIGAFTSAPGPEQPADTVAIYVVSTDGCRLLGSVLQRV